MNKIIRFVAGGIIRNRVVLAYALLLLVFSLGLFNLSRPEKAVLSLLNLVLIVVPLVSIVFATIHYYNSAEFMELLLAQPVDRRFVLLVEGAGVALGLVLAFLVGTGLPMLWYEASVTGLLLVVSGALVTLVFVSLAFLGSVLLRDKARGIGLALLLWFFFALLFDALLLSVFYTFSEYPLEKTAITLTLLNPIDTARMLIITRLDAAALMGQSGSLFRDFLATGWGWLAAGGALLLWIILPAWAAVHVFRRKDF